MSSISDCFIHSRTLGAAALFLLIASIHFPCPASPQESIPSTAGHTHTEVIESSAHAYTIALGGTLDAGGYALRVGPDADGDDQMDVAAQERPLAVAGPTQSGFKLPPGEPHVVEIAPAGAPASESPSTGL